MKAWRHFDIDIVRLSNKIHYFDYKIDSAFFNDFEDSFIHKGDLDVKMTLDKSDAHIITEFTINGNVELSCDRSSDLFDYHIESTNKLIFKYGDEFAELTDEIVTIPKDAQKINVAQYIYEFIGLSVPIKKIHPRFSTEDEDPTEETLLIYSTASPEAEVEEDQVDPRWELLKNIKNNNN
ncbi:MAG TPA: DUF177 domain-containing protein [Cytophagaceae bacterium]|jgi:uncharacterized metal-binding protein YceD (DUF177 family)